MVARCLLVPSFALMLAAFVGCNQDPGGLGEGAQDIIPSATTNLFDQSEVCSLILKRHEVVRPVDMKDGAIRWNCADVPGVTSIDLAKCQAKRQALQDLLSKDAPQDQIDAATLEVRRECQGFGQEYCEYHAVANGKVITKVD